MGDDYGTTPNPWHLPKLGIHDPVTGVFAEQSFEGWEVCPEDDDGSGTYKVANTLNRGWVGFVILRKVEA